jgi:hypothetical protein
MLTFARYPLFLTLFGLLLTWSPAAPVAAADVMSGTELLAFCKNIDGTSKAACYGYLLAVVDSRTLGAAGSERQCELPQRVEMEAVRETIVNQLETEPARQSLSALVAILSGLNQAYPCR